ncbi:unnamed protein product [Psylliodes chrysocephalus]|uniref:MADF domain-containing protein n=1 Tax=Psylliodes chrysocephalus TaxID=3402493 RepID=A0A9P0CNN8_9CUCU|nr:unnamed protein product [Psylliodes chrysocephala]
MPVEQKRSAIPQHKQNQAAYNVLVEKFKEQDNNATIKIVKAKINNLRSGNNKERKKVKGATKSGAGSGNIYEPSLWYYDLFMFLNDTQDEDSSSGCDGYAHDDGEDNPIEETTNHSLNEETVRQSKESRPITKNSLQSVRGSGPTNTKPSDTQVKRPSSSSTNVTKICFNWWLVD